MNSNPLRDALPTEVDDIEDIRQFWIQQRDEHLTRGNMIGAVQISHLIAWLSFAQEAAKIARGEK